MVSIIFNENNLMSQKLLKNSLYLSSGRFLARFLGLINTFIIARILVPDDYAVIATAMILQDLALRVQNIGFSQNLISANKVNDELISSVFVSKVLITLFLSIILFLNAENFANAVDAPRVASVLSVVCWIIFISSLSNINVVLDVRRNYFISEIKTSITSKIISVIATVILAFYLRNYWALAIGMLVAEISRVLLSYCFSDAVIKIKPTFMSMKNVLAYSKLFFF
jgi:lipopolysaccharide exporter